MDKSLTKRGIILALGIIVLVAIGFMPEPAGLTFAGKMSLAIFAVSIVFWVTEVMPIAITGWAMAALVPLLGIIPAAEAWPSSINNAIIFYLCCFGFATFIGRSTVAARLTAKILQWGGTNSSKVLLGLMVVTAIISMFIDNLPLVAVMLPIAYGVLDANNTPTGGSSPLAKCMSFGVLWAAMVGGAMTPSGCIINVLCMSLVEQTTGVTIGFVEWMAFGVPFAVITIFAGWVVLVKMFKPEKLSQQAVDASITHAKELGKLPRNEVFGIAIMLITMVLWVASSWVPQIDIIVVGLLALGVMFFPGINAITIDDYVSDSPWAIMLLVMAVNILVAALTTSGAMEWLVGLIMVPLAGLPLVAVVAILATFVCIIHNFIPSGPACAGLFCIPFTTIIASMGGSITATCAMVAFFSAIVLMMPLEAVPLLSYSSPRKYYTIGDMVKAGAIPSIVMVVITVVITPATAMLLGLA